MRGTRTSLGLAVWLVLCPSLVLACALPPSIIMTLPTGYYMLGAGLTVLSTAAFALWPHRLPQFIPHKVAELRPIIPQTFTSYFGFLAFLALVLIGFLGPRDPMHNLMTLVFWTGVWVGVPLVSMGFGNIWAAINPWTGPVRILRHLFGIKGRIGLEKWGQLPAIFGFCSFTWFQIVSPYPDDPLVLAQLAIGYWVLITALATAEGEEWLEQGEFFTVYFGLIARISPIWIETGPRDKRQLMIGWPGSQIAAMTPLTKSQVIFVTLLLGALSFDGLRETFWWFAMTGQNPLEFAGRSAVMVENTVGLALSWMLTGATIWSALALGRYLSGTALPTGPIMLSFLAIAAGYHGAHYLMMLLTAGQFTIAALNDPLYLGHSYLGLQPYFVSMGFLSDQRVIWTIWNLQFLLILIAHCLAVILALRLSPPKQRAIAHLPLTVVMVLYTIFGLWLLASPTGI